MLKSQKKSWGWLAAFLMVAIGVWIAVSGYRTALRVPEIVRYRLTLPDMDADRPPLRIVLLADIHAGLPDMPPVRVRTIVAQVNALRPDLVLLGGDYVKGAPLGIGTIPMDRALAPLSGLRARLGVIAVLGNNDCAGGMGERAAALLQAGGIRVLRNQAALLPGLAVLGVDDVIHGRGNMGPVKRDFARQVSVLAQAAPGRVQREPVILLAHEPVFAAHAPDYADVTLAGHTHGGQMFPALTGRIIAWAGDLPAARGLMLVKGRPLIISSGAGTNNLPFRIGVPPEIVLLTLAGRPPSPRQ